MKIFFVLLTFFASMISRAQTHYQTIGTIERLDAGLDRVVAPDAKAEIIAEGFDWCEGPLWVAKYKMLLFSDVPRDTVYKWTAAKGKEVYLTPSGYTGKIPRGGEMGSNGLLLDKKGHLVLCQCGNKQIAMMDAPLDKPSAAYIPIADNYQGKKFNSPNDAAYNGKGELYFTDPPYGLEHGQNDPRRDIAFQGVYRANTLGQVSLVTDTLTRPNGIAFFPGGKTMLVSNSDPAKPYWYAFDADEKGNFTNARIFFSAAPFTKGVKGLPDGLKIDRRGNVFATGPGGLFFFSKEGKLLGRLRLTEAASNCALADDEKILYITNDSQVLRLKLRN
jgi:gluconolactonase